MTTSATQQLVGRPNTDSLAAGAYVLGYRDVAEVIRRTGLPQFLNALLRATKDAYTDTRLRTISPRVGWTHGWDTMEVMGCRSFEDYDCLKVISSRPSGASQQTYTVVGTLLMAEAQNDSIVLNCDATQLTSLRTAVNTALAISLISPAASTLGIVGCGAEGTAHAIVVPLLIPTIKLIRFSDIDPVQSKRSLREAATILRSNLTGRSDPELVDDGPAVDELYAESEVVVTATYGTRAVIEQRHRQLLRDGTLIAAIGSDLPSKRELDHAICNDAKFAVDDQSQCIREGELQWVWKGLTNQEKRSRVVSLAALVSHPDNVTAFRNVDKPLSIYDSTGYAGQDLAVGRVLIDLLQQLQWPQRPFNPQGHMSLADMLRSEA
jgi:ornithine cyclodeaminase/alanine dehydrogenase-like protein (mu-crystallin family)